MSVFKRETASKPDSNDDGSASGPSYASPFGNRSVNQLEHDMKIEVAGELFVYAVFATRFSGYKVILCVIQVYELLSNLSCCTSQQGLHNFGPEN